MLQVYLSALVCFDSAAAQSVKSFQLVGALVLACFEYQSMATPRVFASACLLILDVSEIIICQRQTWGVVRSELGT